MCLPIDCWLCTPRTDDDHYHAPPNKHGGAQRNYNGNGYTAHGTVAGGEAERKASNDVNVMRAPAAHAGAGAGAAATRGWHGHGHAANTAHAVPTGAGAGAAAAQEKQADGTLKPPQPVVATNDKVAAADGQRDVAHNYYHSNERQQLPAHKEDTADSYYPAATATADHESPSEALGEK